jgi:hypothetical protein
MRFLAAIGRRWRNGWKRTVGAALTALLLLAVAAAGLALFGSEVFAVWKGPTNAEPALASDGAFGGLLNFEAPAATVARFDVQTEEAQKNIQRASDAPVLVKNWRFTQNDSPLQQILNLYIQGLQLEFVVGFLEAFFPNSPFTAFARAFEQMYLLRADQFLTALGLPPIPVISPSF